MRQRDRSNEIASPLYLGESWFTYAGQDYPDPHRKFYYPGINFTDPIVISRERCFDELHAGPPYKTGGPLDIRKWGTDQYDRETCSLSSGGTMIDRYEGDFITRGDPAALLDWTDPAATKLDGYQWVDPDIIVDGANGWNKAKPTTQNVQVAVTLGELPELPMMLKQTAKNFHHIWKDSGGRRNVFGPKDLADNWLNVNFGWVPFLNDMARLYDTVKYQDDFLNQLRRDNNQWKYARRTVRKTEDFEIVADERDIPGHWPSLSTSYYNSPWGYVRTSKRDSLNVWFVGRFRYYIPDLKVSGPASMWEIAKIYGMYPSPTAVYELTPWSWLLDWFTNYGNCLDNLTSIISEGIVAKYAYVMAHRVQKYTTEAFSNFKARGLSTVRSAWCEQKVRMPADPFGFGSNPADFTTRQWSILGSLGLSKQKVLSR